MISHPSNTQNRKRHCMVVHAYYPLGETRVEREARALIERGHEVDIICLQFPDEEPSEDTVGGAHVYRLPVRRHKRSGLAVQLLEYLAFLALAFVRLTRLHLLRRYAVVQVHNLPDFLIFVALIPKLSGARLILDIHDLMPEFYAARFGTGMAAWPVRLIRWQEWISCRFADHVITVTEPWRETLIERGVPAAKVTVVMNVADESIFHRDPAVQSQSRDDGHFHLIYHGNLTKRYGVDLVLQAVDQVRGQIPNIRLTVHGAGEYLRELKDLAVDLGLQKHVLFSTDFMPTSELPKLILEADIGVVPYRRDLFTDGILPTKLMEYAALGVPAIAACTPAITAYFDETMVQFFTAGDVKDLARCILALYSEPQRRAQLAQGAEKFNQRHNWAKISATYVALVERLSSR
jgi:glycosyltransferase involved in cell wall biosynthesis